MSDPLLDLLRPHVVQSEALQHETPGMQSNISRYLTRLPKLDLNALQNSEPQSLAQAAHSNLLAIQALSSRSIKSLIASSEHLVSLTTTLPSVSACARDIRDGMGKLDGQAVSFSEKYARSTDIPNDALDRRKRALLLARNAERVADMLELPTLLSSAVHSASASVGATQSGSSSSAITTTSTYNAALDLHGHIKRLIAAYPEVELVRDIGTEATKAMREMAVSLIQTLKGPNLKLAGGMRTVGWLRRVAPGLGSATHAVPAPNATALIASSEEEGSLGALFLVCRLANLATTLEALEPLRDLADQETKMRKAGKAEANGHQTEKYLKRFIELFREQSFSIVSMFRSIFPSEDDVSHDQDLGLDFIKMGLGDENASGLQRDRPEPLPSAVSTFPLHLVSNILLPTLRDYLPNILDCSARESLLTQVLYCAASFGRLGGDFSLLLADLYDSDDENVGDDEKEASQIDEWVEIMQKHRIQAARLETMASAGSAVFTGTASKSREAVTT